MNEAVVDADTIAKSRGWVIGRYQADQEAVRNRLFEVVPDLRPPDGLSPNWRDELILCCMGPYLIYGYRTDIVLTSRKLIVATAIIDKKLLQKGKEPKSLRVIWYGDILRVTPRWTGDLGSHVEGGGGYTYGWGWGGTGGVWGQQQPVWTVQHYVRCVVEVETRQGVLQLPAVTTPFTCRNPGEIENIKQFAWMLDDLVNRAWQKSGSK
jgi:hypothetical protein